MTVSRETWLQFFKRWLWILFGRHDWRYRNPYDRTCTVCGCHQVQMCYRQGDRLLRGFWETFADGDHWWHWRADQELAGVSASVKQVMLDYVSRETAIDRSAEITGAYTAHKARQDHFVEHFLRPAYKEFIKGAIKDGLIDPDSNVDDVEFKNPGEVDKP